MFQSKMITVLALSLSFSLLGCPSEPTGEEQQSTPAQTAPPVTETQTEIAETTDQAATPVAGNVELGKQVFMSKTCATCHVISSLEGAVGVIGPALDGLAATAATRQPGKDAETYIRESIEDPNGFVVENYAAAMPALRSIMTDEEYENLVAYLLSL